MDTEKFISAYNASRNGTDNFHFNPLYRTFSYSDGVRECAEAGCYWLIDILGTELPPAFRNRPDEWSCLVTVRVADSAAQIVGEFVDDDPTPYRRAVDYTDLPEGEWRFFVSRDDSKLHCILMSEY